ncbi:MAG: uracil-DNA glycosylase [Tepidisphaerales bacterium]
MADAIRQRLKLWLTSEKAMGLSGEPVVLARSEAPVQTPPAPAAARPAPARPAPARPAPARPLPAVAARPAAAIAPAIEASLAFADYGPFTAPILPIGEKLRVLNELNTGHVVGCTRCRLHEQRTNTVFGEGDPEAKLMFIGEGPGADEDAQGRPFVGRAGQKLNDMIAAMGLKREQVYIGNVVKCRPPENRAPVDDEMDTCFPYLLRQIEVVRPQVIVLLGLTATKAVLKKKLTMSRMRGQWHDFRGIKVMPTWHPSYILRIYTAEVRGQVWHDLQMVMTELGLKAPARRGAE